MHGSRIALPLGAAFACAIAALAVCRAASRPERCWTAQDDPVRLADHALDRSFNADVARREIEAALAGQRRRPRPELSRPRARPQGDGRSGAGRRGSRTPIRRRRPRRAPPAASRRASSPASRRISSALPAPRSATCSCSATSATRCAKARAWRRRAGRRADPRPCRRRHRAHRRHLCLARRRRAGAGRRFGAQGGAQDRPHDRADGRNGSAARCGRSWTGRRCAAPSARPASREPAIAVRAVREAVKVEKSRDLVRMVGDVGRVQTQGRHPGRARRLAASRRVRATSRGSRGSPT